MIPISILLSAAIYYFGVRKYLRIQRAEAEADARDSLDYGLGDYHKPPLTSKNSFYSQPSASSTTSHSQNHSYVPASIKEPKVQYYEDDERYLADVPLVKHASYISAPSETGVKGFVDPRMERPPRARTPTYS